MVTHWANHWDNLPNNETYFTKGMLRRGMTQEKIRNNTHTVFIKKNKQSPKKLGKEASMIAELKRIESTSKLKSIKKSPYRQNTWNIPKDGMLKA